MSDDLVVVARVLVEHRHLDGIALGVIELATLVPDRIQGIVHHRRLEPQLRLADDLADAVGIRPPPEIGVPQTTRGDQRDLDLAERTLRSGKRAGRGCSGCHACHCLADGRQEGHLVSGAYRSEVVESDAAVAEDGDPQAERSAVPLTAWHRKGDLLVEALLEKAAAREHCYAEHFVLGAEVLVFDGKFQGVSSLVVHQLALLVPIRVQAIVDTPRLKADMWLALDLANTIRVRQTSRLPIHVP
mmetsp:Transcript_25054/g.72071  ORF Transcript_25054/g.72071 Transcript_25054/m.72071 type:complete len:244 (-) Transcript_25054:1819-2550(-)